MKTFCRLVRLYYGICRGDRYEAVLQAYCLHERKRDVLRRPSEA